MLQINRIFLLHWITEFLIKTIPSFSSLKGSLSRTERDKKKKNIITQKSGSKLVYLLTLIGIQLKHTERPVACHNTINHLSKHCQDEPQGYGTAHEAWHFWNSRADLLLPLAHLSVDNGQEMWLFLTAGQRPMGYPVSRQDQIPFPCSFSGVRSPLPSQVAVRIHNGGAPSALLLQEYVCSSGPSAGKLTLIGRDQSHRWSPVHSSGISLVCA